MWSDFLDDTVWARTDRVSRSGDGVTSWPGLTVGGCPRTEEPSCCKQPTGSWWSGGWLAASTITGTRAERSMGLEALLRQRVFGIGMGYEDLNDHDEMRRDSVLALACGRDDLTGQKRARARDRAYPLAGSSTLNG